MKINRKLLPREKIEVFADKHGFEMTVIERTHLPAQNKYYASFDHVEVKNGGILTGTYGDGATDEESIADYASQISGERLVFDAYGQNRKEVTAPIFES